MNECPTCFAVAHEGPCTRDPDQVKEEKRRREVAALNVEMDRYRQALEEIANSDTPDRIAWAALEEYPRG